MDKLSLLLNEVGEAVKPDFIFACEMGGHKHGFSHARRDFQNIVEQGLHSRAVCNTSGSYAAVWNIADANVKMLKTDAKKLTCGREVDLVCITFEVHPRGAPQPADVVHHRRAPQPADEIFYLMVGNLHIRTPAGTSGLSLTTRRRLVSQSQLPR